MTTPKQLEGLNLGSGAGSFTPKVIQGFMAQKGLDPNKLTISNVAPPARATTLLSGQVPAIEFFVMAKPGLEAGAKASNTELRTLLLADQGLELYGNGIAATEDYLAKNSDVVKRFVRASLKGWKFTIANPEKAAADQIKYIPTLKSELVVAEIKVVADLAVTAETKKNGLGWFDPAKMKSNLDFVVKYIGVSGIAPKATEFTRPGFYRPHPSCPDRTPTIQTAVQIETQGRADPAPVPFGHFKDVRQSFKRSGQAPLVAIENISFDLKAGHLVTLLGPSGCGKTTFLKIVGGLISASSGTIQINGRDVAEPQPDFGVVFQQANLMPWRSILKNVLFPMEILRRSDSAVTLRAKELLALVGLEGFEQSYPSQLSGGMQQRVALCRALIHKPKLLLMDEPFGALDELTRMEMQDLLLDIRLKTGATVMFVTHSISEAVYISDIVAVFSKRPSVIADYIAVDLPYPRSAEIRYSAEFTDLEHRAGRALGITR